MALQHSNYSAKTIKYLLSSPMFENRMFSLFDVGASGGIDKIWRQFEPKLKAVGFEPMIGEVERLNKAEGNSNVKYLDCFIGAGEEVASSSTSDGHLNNYSYAGTSGWHATTLLRERAAAEGEGVAKDKRVSEEKLTVDRYMEESGDQCDFLKVDTDGSDFATLKGAETLLDSGCLLGVQIECQFHGSTHPNANTFSNIDQFLRSKGYTLYDIDCWRYSKRELPKPFCYSLAAQTFEGQIQWADALYLQDSFSHEGSLDRLVEKGEEHRALLLIALFDLFGLSDCSAALIVRLQGRGVSLPGIDFETLLDLEVPENRWGIVKYRDYIGKFKEDPTLFYPNALHR